MSNYQQFNFNQKKTKKADGGGRIESTGKYVGYISHAEFVTSKKGTQGIEFNFIASDESTASFTIWTHQADGNTIFGFDKVNSILACTKTKSLTPTDRVLDKYDFETQQKIKQTCVVAPELDNKPIGLLLQRENYQNKSGDWRYQMNFYSAFEAGTEFMAAEILDGSTKPVALEKVLARLINAGDTTRKSSNSQNSGFQQQNGSYANKQDVQQTQQQVSGYPSDLDDDLPF